MKIPLLSVLVLFAATAASAEVIPVPQKVAVEKIGGAKPRNVVFILSDDHRYDAKSFMDHQFAETLEMDRLAANGVHLENAFATTSLCSPSRASILTGLYTFRNRVVDNQRLVPPGTLYFPQWLQKAGYATGWMMQQRGAGRPFFVYLSHKAVHANFTPAERHEDSFADLPFERPATENPSEEKSDVRPRWVGDQRNSWHGVDFPYHSDLDIEGYYKPYCETLSAVDDSISRVVQQLKDMGIYEETLVTYMGDNGFVFVFGEHGLIDKRVAYEASIRVPMIMQCPELFDSGTVVEDLVANIDIAPTNMHAMGLRNPAHMDGESFIPLAQGQNIPWHDKFLYVYYWEKAFPQSPTVFALRTDRYKYINYHGLWTADELYDLQNDPLESSDLLYDPAYRAIAREFHRELYAMMDNLGGMEIPLNAPSFDNRNLRLESRGRHLAADFPKPLVDEEPDNTNAY